MFVHVIFSFHIRLKTLPSTKIEATLRFVSSGVGDAFFRRRRDCPSSLSLCFTFKFFFFTVMMSTLASSVHRLAPPPSVQIFEVSGPWLEPTGTVPFSRGSWKSRSSSTAVHSYTISFHSCTLLLSSRSLCSSAPVNRLEPDEMLRQSHSYSQQHLLLTSAPEMASNVYLDCYSGESFCTIKGYISSPICLAAQTVHSDETRFSPAALFISSTRSLGGVQFGDPNPSNITIWVGPLRFLFTDGFIGTIYTTFITIILLSGDASRITSCHSYEKCFPPQTLNGAVCSSCVAVRSGPEDATDVVSTIFRGADWILTSRYKVTKFQAFSIALSLAPTHSSHASSSMSFYFRGFSTFSLYALLFVVRVWLNSFLICSWNV
ncbi:hypothetical protein HID58_080467 [Brassica napus]|uniref:Uncharacterized protein n=1 Tax=Brassica napus TaxID=3708 RepID=A0ABQ7Y530_BRANA|nr:hypothetical protein HID58_080467 [Brassica napus]